MYTNYIGNRTYMYILAIFQMYQNYIGNVTRYLICTIILTYTITNCNIKDFEVLSLCVSVCTKAFFACLKTE